MIDDTVYIHPSSDVSSEVEIGHGAKIWQHCTVLSGARIGSGSLLSQNVYVEGKVFVGNNAKIKNNVSLYDGVYIEEDVFIGPSAVFTNVLTPRSHWPKKQDFKKTIVKKGATVGANATVVCGVTIGCYAMIGAGSVITRDVPDFTLAYGNPAEIYDFVCQCGLIIKGISENEYICSSCKSRYFVKHGKLIVVELTKYSNITYKHYM